jgi:uncharacterized protein YjiK
MFYGLLIAGGLFAYYAWKKNSEKNKALNTSTSGTFVDDVSVLESKPITNSLFQLDDEIKKSVSIISEPIMKNNEQYNPINKLV